MAPRSAWRRHLCARFEIIPIDSGVKRSEYSDTHEPTLFMCTIAFGDLLEGHLDAFAVFR